MGGIRMKPVQTNKFWSININRKMGQSLNFENEWESRSKESIDFVKCNHIIRAIKCGSK